LIVQLTDSEMSSDDADAHRTSWLFSILAMSSS